MRVYVSPRLVFIWETCPRSLWEAFFLFLELFFFSFRRYARFPVMKCKSGGIFLPFFFFFFFVGASARCLLSPLFMTDMTGKLWPQRGPNGASYCTNINQSLFSEMDDSCSVSDYPSAHYP